MRCCRAFDCKAALQETGPTKSSISDITARIADATNDVLPTLLFQRAMLYIAAGNAKAARDDARLIDMELAGTPHTIYIRARANELEGDKQAAIKDLAAASELLLLRHPRKGSKDVHIISQKLANTGMSVLAQLWQRSKSETPLEPASDAQDTPCEFLLQEIDGRAAVLQLGLSVNAATEDLYIRQMIPGRDICRGSPGWLSSSYARVAFAIARGLKDAPAIYAIGSRASKACVLVNAAWDPEGVLSVVKKDGMRPIALAVTSARIEHTGGKPDAGEIALAEANASLRGLKHFLKHKQLKSAHVYVHSLDASQVASMTGIDPARIRTVQDGESIILANSDYNMRFIHTPGTSPGAMCIVVEKEAAAMIPSESIVLTGDTLLLPPGNSGRMDVDGSNPELLQKSVNKLFSLLPDNTLVLPGRIVADCPLLSGPLQLFQKST